ncbi:class C sortase [Clostridium sardiniense]|uniref:Class C sortase n=2 Tax=Clostridium sardiniense TaxID=29369 RepID=A0ABS7L279_CLOSR|nr:class C sortase [Clostridium sardiniense]
MMTGKKLLVKGLFIVGLLICSYPIVSNLIEGYCQKNIIETYSESVCSKETNDLENEYKKGVEYNGALYSVQTPNINKTDNINSILNEDSYNNILNMGNGVMGSIEIPKINVKLPIYHGTSDEVLSVGVGHVFGSSLPIGGANTRSVLTGHRGLPSAKLFTRLDELDKGDLFFIRVLDKTLAYKVSDIKVILPEDINSIRTEKGRDLVSLITCTPYGINTHRLVVTGERVSFVQSEYEDIKPSSLSFREMLFFSIPLIFIFLVGTLKIKTMEFKKK